MTHRSFVVVVPPQKEFRAAEAFRALGVDAYTPTEYRYRRANWRSKKKIASPYVLMNRYVIVCAPDLPWSAFERLRLRGLATGYLSADESGRPAALPSSEAAHLRSLGDHVPPTTIRVNGGLKAGDRAVICDGPFTGRTVKVERIRKGRGLAFIEWLGRTHEIHFPLHQLVAA